MRTSSIRIVTLATTISLVSGLVTGPATAEPAKRKPAEVISVSVVQGNEPHCLFTGKTDSFEAILELPDRYWALKKGLLTKIRADLPQASSLFERADHITGTGHEANDGSLNNPELATIFEQVSKEMIAAGYDPNGSETYLAFWHSPQGEKATAGFSYSTLQFLPQLTLSEAKAWLALRQHQPHSITNDVDTFYKAAAALRTYLNKLDQSSVAVLNRLDDKQFNAVRTATKETTTLTPADLERAARYFTRRCISNLRLKSFYGSTSWKSLSSEDDTSSSGSADDNQADKGNLSTASTDLSAGEGLSTAAEVGDLSSNGSSKSNEQKTSTLLLVVSLIGAVATIVTRFRPLFENFGAVWNQMVDDAAAGKEPTVPGE